MPIELFTGLPGGGKTSLMVERLLKEAKAAKRPIVAAGIEGLDEGLALPLDDPKQWNAKDDQGQYLVPDGSLIFVDEAWKWFGHLHDAQRQASPPHVLQLAEHRHRGIDFVWTTQDPAQIYPFARKMIARHSHVVRRFGTKWLDVFTWEELQEDVKSGAKRDNAQRQTRTLPEHAHKHYKSATVHTIKAKLPLKLFILPLAIAGAFASFWIAYNYFKPSAVAARLGSPLAGADAPLGAPAPTDGHADAPAGGRPRDVAAYIKDFQPRIAAAPWTAPAWDKRGVVSDPELFCMASEPGEDVNGKWRDASCSCITEQGTRYAIDNAECRRLATEGPVYNPFKRPQQRSEREQRRAEVREEEEQRPQLRETATPYGAAPPPAGRFALDPVRSSP